jgi:hypothetical protein
MTLKIRFRPGLALILAGIVLLTLLLCTATATATECTTVCYVDDATGDDANGGTSPADAKKTVQAAINQVLVNGTVIVASGTYTVTGVVTVNKTITLQGAQVGVCAGTRSGPESILQNSGGLFVTANDVSLDGFTVQNSTSEAFTGYGIYLAAGTSGAHIINNIIQDNIAGIGLANNPGGNQALIQCNLFRNNTRSGEASGHGIYSDQFVAGVGGVDGVLIDNNDFVNDNGATSGTWGIGMGNTEAAPFMNLQITNNRFDSASPDSRGMYLYNTDSSLIKNNSFKNKTSYAIGLFFFNDGITIECNIIQNSNLGIFVREDGGNSSITVFNNSISGNATAGLQLGTLGYTGGPGSLNAENNWWGSATGPNPPGSGDAIIDPDGVVDAVPFLTSAPGPGCPVATPTPTPTPPPTGGNGAFVIGDLDAVVGRKIYFWGSQWAKTNKLSGGAAPSAFKGFANSIGGTTPNCGGVWKSDPGNSSGPPNSVPTLITVIASSSVTKSGSVIMGNNRKIIVVKVDPGYGPNPGHEGTGTVVSVTCQ